jgi:alkanesulfonate monooxygenase SsuD/methylene tetrahydromethanopterin reductase-like flavin-dependent oxidoreductase (luciferase family)
MLRWETMGGIVRFSIYCNPQTRGPEEDVAHIDLTIEQAIKATEAGFDGGALTEHHVSGYNTFGDNILMAAHLAPQLRKDVRFCLAIVVPQLHHPMRLAQSCNLLDVLCRGNVIIGMGAGGSPLEFTAHGRNPLNRHSEMMEVIDVVGKMLSYRPGAAPYEWATTYEKGVLSTRVMPSSLSPRVKFARAAQSNESVTWTAQQGWYLMTARAPIAEIVARFRLYSEALKRAALDEDHLTDLLDWSSLSRQLVIAETDREAQQHARIIVERLASGLRQNWSAQSSEKSGGPTFTKEALGISAENPDAFLEGAMLVGSPDTIRKRINEISDGGIRHLMLCFNYGHMSAEQANRQLDLFLSDVYPYFKHPQQAPRLTALDHV